MNKIILGGLLISVVISIFGCGCIEKSELLEYRLTVTVYDENGAIAAPTYKMDFGTENEAREYLEGLKELFPYGRYSLWKYDETGRTVVIETKRWGGAPPQYNQS